MRITLLLLVVSACAADGVPFAPEVLPTELHLDTADEGVHPDRSVLDDPDNPFATGELSDETVWRVQSSGGNVAAFYAWATANARGASGERQYYTALDLKAIYTQEQAVDDDLDLTRDLAIRGFQAVLDYFPDAVTYDASGTVAYELATPSVQAILDLGGEVMGGWVLVTRADGSVVAVQQ